MEAKFKTTCEHCCFAQWKGNKQTGCELNRLECFAVNGVELDRVETEGKTHYEVGRRCNACRNTSWPHHDSKDRLRQVYLEIVTPVDVIIEFDGKDFDGLHRTLDSLKNNFVPPYSVSVLDETASTANFKKIIDKLKEIGRPYKYTNAPEALLNRPEHLSKMPKSPVDEVLRQTKGLYYAVAKSPFIFPSNFIDKLELRRNYDMERFMLVEGEFNIIHRGLYRKFGTHLDIVKKTKVLCEIEKCQIIKTMESLLDCQLPQ